MSRLIILLAYLTAAVFAQEWGLRTEFRLKYVAEGVVYLDGGRSGGLAEGMHLTVRRGEREPLAELVVTSVATVSAACEIRNSRDKLLAGDLAILSSDDAELARKAEAAEESHHYAQVVSFTEGDPLDQ